MDVAGRSFELNSAPLFSHIERIKFRDNGLLVSLCGVLFTSFFASLTSVFAVDVAIAFGL